MVMSVDVLPPLTFPNVEVYLIALIIHHTHGNNLVLSRSVTSRIRLAIRMIKNRHRLNRENLLGRHLLRTLLSTPIRKLQFHVSN